VSTRRFTIDTEFVWQKTHYNVKRILPDNLIEIESMLDGQCQMVQFQALYRELVNGQLVFIEKAERTPIPKKISLEDSPAKQREVAEYRLLVIEPLLKIPPHHRTNQDIVNRVKEVEAAQSLGEFPMKPISRSSVYRWLSDYSKDGNDIRRLVPKARSKSPEDQKRLSPRVEKIIQEVIKERYFVRERVKVDDILHEVVVRIDQENRELPEDKHLPFPSHTTIWRRIDAQDFNARLIAKKGRRAAKAEMTQYGQMEPPRFPLERVEIDHTLTDIFVVDEDDNLPLGRMTLTYCLDVATRYPLGFYLGFEPPSYLTVSACLYHAMLPKPDAIETFNTSHQWQAFGVPNMLVVDNGKEFIGTSLQGACLSLGIILQQLPVRTPHFKAVIERNFRRLNTGLFHTLPGTTFSNFAMKGDYDSLQYACLSRQDLYQMIHIFLLDIYAETFHRGLGAVPAREWERALEKSFLPRVPSDPQELSIMLGRTDRRVIHHYGIDFKGIRYNAESLALLRHRLKQQGDTERATVKIKYRPDNLGSIYIFDEDLDKYVKVPALDQDYAAGLTLWSHEIIRHQVLKERDRVSLKALGEAKRKIQEIVQASRERSKKRRPRKKLARFEESKNGAVKNPSNNGFPTWFIEGSFDKQVEDESVEDLSSHDGWSLEH
jgi:putative transposase